MKFLRTALVALVLVPLARAQGPFSGCGTITQGVTCPRLFTADAGGTYVLDNLGGFQLGARVLVTGTLDPGCITICQQGNGCIQNNTISACNAPVPFCAGDGLDPSVTTPCPCGNNGAPGHGCANSVQASGALLGSSGTPNPDTLQLQGSSMPDTVSCIYLQGDALEDVVFGDGVRCAGGTLIRLRTKTNVGGASAFPDSTDTITLSARGGVTPGSGVIRHYQVYYRNAAPLFCPPETFNVSNGLTVTW